MLHHSHILGSIKISCAQDHNVTNNNIAVYDLISQSQWPHGFRRGSAAAGLLGLWVRIPPEPWVSASCEWWVPSGEVCGANSHSSKGVLPIVVYLSVVVKPRQLKRPWPTRSCRATKIKKKKLANGL